MVQSFYIMAQEINGAEYSNQLFLHGKIGITDLPARSIFVKETCGSKLNSNGSLDEHLKLFCQVVTRSDHCKKVSPKDLMNCKDLQSNMAKESFDLIQGCISGLFHSAKDLL